MNETYHNLLFPLDQMIIQNQQHTQDIERNREKKIPNEKPYE